MNEVTSASDAVQLWIANLERDLDKKTRLQLTAEEVKGDILDICIDARQPRDQLPDALRSLLAEAESRIEAVKETGGCPSRFTLNDILNRARSSLTELQVSI